MRRTLVRILLFGALLVSVQAPSAHALDARPVSIPRLIEEADKLDGTVVVIEGEAIGEALRADAGAVWVNVLDEGVAIGVWMPRSFAEGIEHWGRYQETGDTVRVTGTVHLACDQHGGDLDVHATSLEVAAPGGPRRERVRQSDALLGVAGFACAAVVMAIAWREKRIDVGSGSA